MGKAALAGLLCIVMCVQVEAQRRRRPSRTPGTPADEQCVEPLGQRVLSCNPSSLGWTSVDAPVAGTPGLRFWRRTACADDADVARQLAAKGQAMWDFVKGYMNGRQPLFDGDVGCEKGNGGGPQLDVFLRHYPPTAIASTRPIPYDEERVCRPVPTFINMKVHTDVAVVHELIHSTQYAFQWKESLAHCPDDPDKLRWWSEATASAGDARYAPGRNPRHEAIQHYLKATHRPLDVRRVNEGYEVYLFPLYLDAVLGRGIIGRTWAALENATSVVEAIAGATASGSDDGFAVHWPEFTRQLLNEAPWDLFARIDGVTSGVQPREHELRLERNEPDRTLEITAGELQRLSAVFHRVKIGDGVHSLTILNPNAKSPDPRVRIQALIRKAGDVVEEDDWTDDERKFFCIDLRAERVTEIVLVISNSEWEPGAPPKKLEPLRIIATNAGCFRYRGRASEQRDGTQRFNFKEFSFVIALAQRGSAADVVFDVGPFPVPPGFPAVPPPELHAFFATSGSVQWTWTGSWTPLPDGCSGGSGSGSAPVQPGNAMIFSMNGSRPDLPGYREYYAAGFVPVSFTICGDPAGEKIAFLQGNALKLAPDGHIRMEGTQTETHPIGTMKRTMSWDLAPEREP